MKIRWLICLSVAPLALTVFLTSALAGGIPGCDNVAMTDVSVDSVGCQLLSIMSQEKSCKNDVVMSSTFSWNTRFHDICSGALPATPVSVTEIFAKSLPKGHKINMQHFYNVLGGSYHSYTSRTDAQLENPTFQDLVSAILETTR